MYICVLCALDVLFTIVYGLVLRLCLTVSYVDINVSLKFNTPAMRLGVYLDLRGDAWRVLGHGRPVYQCGVDVSGLHTWTGDHQQMYKVYKLNVLVVCCERTVLLKHAESLPGNGVERVQGGGGVIEGRGEWGFGESRIREGNDGERGCQSPLL